MAVDLQFARRHDAAAVTPPVHLVFGAQEAGRTEALRYGVSARLRLPAAGLRGRVAVALGVRGACATSAPRLHGRLRWLANVWRPVAASAYSGWQQAQPVQRTCRMAWQAQSAPVQQVCGVRWQMATPMQRGIVLYWHTAQRLWCHSATHWQSALLHLAATHSQWQGSARLWAATAVHWQRCTSAQMRVQSAIASWQSVLRLWQARTTHWQTAVPVAQSATTPIQSGSPLCPDWHVRWQWAMYPAAGRSPRPITPTAPTAARPVCYHPPHGLAVHLQFDDASAPASGQHVPLVFVCCKRTDSPTPHPLAKRRVIHMSVYTHLHQCTATLWPPTATGSTETVPLFEVSLSSDADGYAWQMQASGPAVLFEMLAPDMRQGVLPQLRISINGMQWIVVVHSRRRSRQFGQTTVQITGASATSLLDAPHAAVQTWGNAEQQTAQQLVLDALAHTGCTLDWQIDDWLIPARLYSHQGSPLNAALRIADAVGAVVQSDRSAATLRYLPRYPAMPWEWHRTTPDVQLPLSYVLLDDLTESTTPPYNAITTSGTTAGVVRRTTRSGTAGDIAAPMVTDALLTETAAHVQRARAELGRGGWQAQVGMTLPLDVTDSGAGLLDIGQLVRIDESATQHWLGMVRGVRIQASAHQAAVRQQVTLERHLHQ